MKKPEHPQRSVRKIDGNVVDYACENGCVKVANVRSVEVGKNSMIECSPGGRSQASAHKNTRCVPIYCAGQVRGRLTIVCGAPGPTA